MRLIHFHCETGCDKAVKFDSFHSVIENKNENTCTISIVDGGKEELFTTAMTLRQIMEKLIGSRSIIYISASQ